MKKIIYVLPILFALSCTPKTKLNANDTGVQNENELPVSAEAEKLSTAASVCYGQEVKNFVNKATGRQLPLKYIAKVEDRNNSYGKKIRIVFLTKSKDSKCDFTSDQYWLSFFRCNYLAENSNKFVLFMSNGDGKACIPPFINIEQNISSEGVDAHGKPINPTAILGSVDYNEGTCHHDRDLGTINSVNGIRSNINFNMAAVQDCLQKIAP